MGSRPVSGYGAGSSREPPMPVATGTPKDENGLAFSIAAWSVAAAGELDSGSGAGMTDVGVLYQFAVMPSCRGLIECPACPVPGLPIATRSARNGRGLDSGSRPE